MGEFGANVGISCAPYKGGAFQWVRIPSGNRSSRKQVTPVEGRDLSSRQTQYVVKDLGRLRNLSTPINVQKLQMVNQALTELD
jgi:hypothetical protein